jgi:hypothetical protein
MKKLVAISTLTLLLGAVLLADETEVSFDDLVAKPSEYEGKTVRVACSILYARGQYLAVKELQEGDEGVSFEGQAVLLKKVKSSVKKKLSKGKHKKKTAYHGSVVITGEVKTGEFGRDKDIKVQITVTSVETGGSGEFEVLKKSIRTKTDLPPEDAVKRARQAVRRDGFNPPTYPDYHDGSSLSVDTQVLCITDGKQHKVYTIASMGTCELVNDKIGGVPVAVTW